MKPDFNTKNQCVEYLKSNFYNKDFIDRHTRKELAYILGIIEGYEKEENPHAFQSMCKGRMYMHIEFYLKTHGYSKTEAENKIKADAEKKEMDVYTFEDNYSADATRKFTLDTEEIKKSIYG